MDSRSLSTWFGSHPVRLRRRCRPNVQRLEPRALLTTLTYHGGPVLTQIDLQPFYYGSYWKTTSTGQENVAVFDHFLSDIINNDPADPGEPSLFLDTPLTALDPFGSPGTSGNLLSPKYANVAVASGQQIDDSYIQSILPDSPNANQVDLFMAPPGTWVSAGSSSSLPGSASPFLGYHSYEIGSNGIPIYYMVIVYPGWPNVPVPLTPFNQITVVTSHEIAETITDPQFTGWYDDSLGPSLGETGDVCPGPSNELLFQPSIALQDFYLMQAVWFNQLGHGGLPGLVDGSYHFSPHPLSQTVTAAADGSYQGILANFSVAGGLPGDFTVQIAWGDGTTSSGQIVAASDGSFNIEGSHTFATTGDYLAGLTIKDSANGQSIAAYPDIAVSNIQLMAASPAAFAGVAYSGGIGTFSDPGARPAISRSRSTGVTARRAPWIPDRARHRPGRSSRTAMGPSRSWAATLMPPPGVTRLRTRSPT